ncbi:MAG: DinB family protein [Chitinophagaceae bacterium]|nr:DinB family protein [Chitinophagaceae bacterium]
MIKRTTGRLLLLLLVITGFAGTISDNAISKDERKYAAGLMKETYKEALKSVKGLSEAQLSFKAAPDKWSVKECLYHIAGAEKFLWTLFEGSMKAPANPEKRSEIKVTDEQFVKMVMDRTKAAQAPEPIQPKNTGFQGIDAAIADFKTNRMEHIKYIKNSTEDLRNHVVQMPFGWIDCYQLYLLIAAHSNRHTQQINEVKASAGFPAN